MTPHLFSTSAQPRSGTSRAVLPPSRCDHHEIELASLGSHSTMETRAPSTDSRSGCGASGVARSTDCGPTRYRCWCAREGARRRGERARGGAAPDPLGMVALALAARAVGRQGFEPPGVRRSHTEVRGPRVWRWRHAEWAARGSNPARRIKSPELYLMS